MWGSNKHGQLAATDTFLPSPSLVKRTLLAGEKVTRVWSGWTHIVAQTGDSTIDTSVVMSHFPENWLKYIF